MKSIRLNNILSAFNGEVMLPASKSISNRALIIQALCSKEQKYPFHIHNISEAEDTRLMAEALNTEVEEIYVRNAGTAMRFLAAYFAQSEKEVILKGSEGMNRRPIAPLVEALQALGADISYFADEGFPPLHIKGRKLRGSVVKVQAAISSQFISALMLIAPLLPDGLAIEFEGDIVSMPYITMTAGVMGYFGVYENLASNKIIIPPQKYIPRDYYVEGDWSAASYFYALAALKPLSRISFPLLFEESLQGDSFIRFIMQSFGVETLFENDRCTIFSHGATSEPYAADLINHPDLIPTMVCLCIAARVPFTIHGTRTLKHKESDRAEALKTEPAKLGIHITLSENSISCFSYPEGILSQDVLLNTYNDHRLVMSFAVLAVAYPGILIEDPEEVRKSFPGFWEEVKKIGIE